MAEQVSLEAGSGRIVRVRLVIWAGIVLLGLSRLHFPLGGDQALFLSYAQGLDQGARLYVDLWDVKQPGVFWFYWLAGKLFGFSSVGIHLLEWLWLAAGGLVLWKACRLSFRSALAPELVPLLTVGIYYWWAGFWYLAQVEILVMLPLAGCVLASVVALRRPSSMPAMHLVFGVCAGVVAIFKLVLIIVPAAMWPLLCILLLRARGPSAKSFWLGMLLPAVLGAAAPLAMVAWHFHSSGSWDIFFWTQFVYPRAALAAFASKEPWQLARGASWLLAFAAPAAVLSITRFRLLRSQSFSAVELLAATWLIAGAIAIVLQKFSWWTYHFLLLLPPVGLLTAALLDRHLVDSEATRGRRANGRRPDPVVASVLVAAFLLLSLHSVRTMVAVAAAVKSPSGQRVTAFREAFDPHYRERIEESAFLRDPSSPPGPIYVFGSPNWLLAAHRTQALPIHGWAWEVMLAEQWADLPIQLRTHRPAFIYVDAAYRPDIEKHAPTAAAFIRSDYEPVARTAEDGIWYRLRDAPRGDRSAAGNGS